MHKKKGIIIASAVAVAVALAVAGCSQKPPRPGSAEMTKSMKKNSCGGKGKAGCKANMCKANMCKANSCKGKNGKTCSAKNGCSGKR